MAVRAGARCGADGFGQGGRVIVRVPADADAVDREAACRETCGGRGVARARWLRVGGLDGCRTGVDTAGDGGGATYASGGLGVVHLEDAGSWGGDGVDPVLYEGTGDAGLLNAVVRMATAVAALRVWFGICESGKDDGE